MGVLGDIAQQEGDADKEQQQADARDRVAAEKPRPGMGDGLIDD